MKFHVMSDLHLEFYATPAARGEFWQKLDYAIARDKPEAAILAGDINLITRHEFESTLAEFCQRYPWVYYTPGNHEFIHYGIADGHAKLRDIQARQSNLTVLLPGVKMLAGVQPDGKAPALSISGGTMWYPDCKDRWLKRGWFDYAHIPDAHREIQPCYELFVENVIVNPTDVVVSHMLPTGESIAQEWAGSDTNVFFCADVASKIQAVQASTGKSPKLWIHGHTHNPFDFKSQLGFRIFCNPRGYPSEAHLNPKFWERLLVDTEDVSWYLKTYNGGSNDE